MCLQKSKPVLCALVTSEHVCWDYGYLDISGTGHSRCKREISRHVRVFQIWNTGLSVVLKRLLTSTKRVVEEFAAVMS